MIKVNNRDFPWSENLSVEVLLKLKKYTFPKIIVRINGKLILKEEYASTLIYDNDDVKVIHMLAGG